MAHLVALFGLVIAAIGVLGVVQPSRLLSGIAAWNPEVRFFTAVGVRLILGVLFLAAAPSCRWPTAVTVLGAITLIAAFALALMGSRRLEAMVRWWLERPANAVRATAGVAVAFGALLVYAAL